MGLSTEMTKNGKHKQNAARQTIRYESMLTVCYQLWKLHKTYKLRKYKNINISLLASKDAK
jgi:hypothetical protein